MAAAAAAAAAGGGAAMPDVTMAGDDRETAAALAAAAAFRLRPLHEERIADAPPLLAPGLRAFAHHVERDAAHARWVVRKALAVSDTSARADGGRQYIFSVQRNCCGSGGIPEDADDDEFFSTLRELEFDVVDTGGGAAAAGVAVAGAGAGAAGAAAAAGDAAAVPKYWSVDGVHTMRRDGENDVVADAGTFDAFVSDAVLAAAVVASVVIEPFQLQSHAVPPFWPFACWRDLDAVSDVLAYHARRGAALDAMGVPRAASAAEVELVCDDGVVVRVGLSAALPSAYLRDLLEDGALAHGGAAVRIPLGARAEDARALRDARAAAAASSAGVLRAWAAHVADGAALARAARNAHHVYLGAAYTAFAAAAHRAAAAAAEGTKISVARVEAALAAFAAQNTAEARARCTTDKLDEGRATRMARLHLLLMCGDGDDAAADAAAAAATAAAAARGGGAGEDDYDAVTTRHAAEEAATAARRALDALDANVAARGALLRAVAEFSGGDGGSASAHDAATAAQLYVLEQAAADAAADAQAAAERAAYADALARIVGSVGDAAAEAVAAAEAAARAAERAARSKAFVAAAAAGRDEAEACALEWDDAASYDEETGARKRSAAEEAAAAAAEAAYVVTDDDAAAATAVAARAGEATRIDWHDTAVAVVGDDDWAAPRPLVYSAEELHSPKPPRWRDPRLPYQPRNTGYVVRRVASFLEAHDTHGGLPRGFAAMRALRGATPRAWGLPPWCVTWLAAVEAEDAARGVRGHETIARLLLAADYLDIPALRGVLTAAFAAHMGGASSAAIREELLLPNDFTVADDARVQHENTILRGVVEAPSPHRRRA